jgi:hypothetical protein
LLQFEYEMPPEFSDVEGLILNVEVFRDLAFGSDWIMRALPYHQTNPLINSSLKRLLEGGANCGMQITGSVPLNGTACLQFLPASHFLLL